MGFSNFPRFLHKNCIFAQKKPRISAPPIFSENEPVNNIGMRNDLPQK